MDTKTVVVLGDTHFPFHSHDAVDRAIELIGELKPDMVIQVGDLYDLFSYSKYPRTPNLILPKDECALGRECAEILWRDIGKASPRSERVQLAGNHDDRLMKRIFEIAPNYEHVTRDYFRSLLTFPGVHTVHDSKEEFIYGGVCYMHGYKKFGEHAPYNQMSTVTGHLHRAGVLYFQNINGPFWELNAGWLGDKTSPVFTYRSQNKITGTTCGVGLVDALGPRFVALE